MGLVQSWWSKSKVKWEEPSEAVATIRNFPRFAKAQEIVRYITKYFVDDMWQTSPCTVKERLTFFPPLLFCRHEMRSHQSIRLEYMKFGTRMLVLTPPNTCQMAWSMSGRFSAQFNWSRSHPMKLVHEKFTMNNKYQIPGEHEELT